MMDADDDHVAHGRNGTAIEASGRVDVTEDHDRLRAGRGDVRQEDVRSEAIFIERSRLWKWARGGKGTGSLWTRRRSLSSRSNGLIVRLAEDGRLESNWLLAVWNAEKLAHGDMPDGDEFALKPARCRIEA